MCLHNKVKVDVKYVREYYGKLEGLWEDWGYATAGLEVLIRRASGSADGRARLLPHFGCLEVSIRCLTRGGSGPAPREVCSRAREQSGQRGSHWHSAVLWCGPRPLIVGRVEAPVVDLPL